MRKSVFGVNLDARDSRLVPTPPKPPEPRRPSRERRHWLTSPGPDHRGHVRGALSIQVGRHELQCNVRLRAADPGETWLVACLDAPSGLDLGIFHVCIDGADGVTVVSASNDRMATHIDRLAIAKALAIALDEHHSEMWSSSPQGDALILPFPMGYANDAA